MQCTQVFQPTVGIWVPRSSAAIGLLVPPEADCVYEFTEVGSFEAEEVEATANVIGRYADIVKDMG